jgi:hypothetical protein
MSCFEHESGQPYMLCADYQEAPVPGYSEAQTHILSIRCYTV